MHYSKFATLFALLLGLGCASAQGLYERDADADADIFDFEDLEAREEAWWKSSNADSGSSSSDSGAAVDMSDD